MKILQVVHGFPLDNLAGTEVYTYNLAKELAKRHQISVFHRFKDAGRKEYEVIHREENGVDIFALNNTFKYCNSFKQTYRNEEINKAFVAVLEKVRPDIVHIQHLLFLSTTIVEEIKNRGIPIVFTLHDYCLFCSRGQLLKYDLSLCAGPSTTNCAKCLFAQLSIKSGLFRLYAILNKRIPTPVIQLAKKIYLHNQRRHLGQGNTAQQINAQAEELRNVRSLIDIFISPSKFVKDSFVSLGIPENKIMLSRYGFNLELFKSTVENKQAEKFSFGFLGILLPAKGVHLLIKAFNRLKREDVQLKIFAKLTTYKGYESYLLEVRKLAKLKNIHLRGEFENKDIGQILAGIDCLVVPSIWYENSPLVIQEALLAKTTVIAADIGGIPELIENGKNGLLFRPNNVDDLYAKMKQIIKNPWLMEKFAKEKTNIKSIEENAGELEKIYQDLIRRAKIGERKGNSLYAQVS